MNVLFNGRNSLVFGSGLKNRVFLVTQKKSRSSCLGRVGNIEIHDFIFFGHKKVALNRGCGFGVVFFFLCLLFILVYKSA